MNIIIVSEPAGEWGSVITEMYESFQQWKEKMDKMEDLIDKIYLYDVEASYADLVDNTKPEGSYKKMLYFIRYKAIAKGKTV